MKKKITGLLFCLLIICCMVPATVFATETETTTEEKAVTTETLTAAQKKRGKKTIFVAAGHQKNGISSKEAMAPGSKKKKAKLASGATGVATHIPEYKTNLAIAKAVRKELEKRGYKVIMLRTTNTCTLSNKQRTQKANKAKASVHVCIHCNAGAASATGPLVCLPASAKYIGKSIYKKSVNAGNKVVNAVAKATGKKVRNAIRSNDYTTINWAKVPTFILECGFLSNREEDRQLNSEKYQKKIAKGIANGLDQYFGIK